MVKFKIITLFSILFAILQSSFQQHVGEEKKLDMNGFRKCVKKCFDQFTVCTDKFKSSWVNFSDKPVRDKITKGIRKCCLDRETDRTADETVSFATCTRVLCEAELWGCKIRKVHKVTETVHGD